MAAPSIGTFHGHPRPAGPRRPLAARLVVMTAILATAFATPSTGAAGSPQLSASPSSVMPGSVITVRGSGFSKGQRGYVAFDISSDGAAFGADGKGRFSVQLLVPGAATSGTHTLSARGTEPTRRSKTTSSVTTLASTSISVVSASTTPGPGATAVAPPSLAPATAAPSEFPTDAHSTAGPNPTMDAAPTPTVLPNPTTGATPKPSVTPTAVPDPTAPPAPDPTEAPTAPPTSAPTPGATAAPTSTFYVASTGSDSAAGSSSSPWRTIGHAVASAPAGSTIRIGPGTYAPFTVSRPSLTVEPLAGAEVIVAGGTTAIVIKAARITIRGLRVTGASHQGIWVDGASDVVLTNLEVVRNTGHGIQVIRSSGVRISNSTFSGNRLSGIRELSGTSGGRYTSNTITDNGHDQEPYNGDGLALQGAGAYVAGNVIMRNGDSPTFEHGIYAAATASGYEITDNVVRDNSASGIKASGQGSVTYNTITGSIRGIVFADDGGLVTISHNSVHATLYAIAVTSNCVLSRYRSDYNTFVTEVFGLGGPVDFAGWRTRTGLDLHSS